MRLIPLLVATALATTLSFTCLRTASAQSAQPSAADAQTLHDYTLTDAFLAKWEAIMADPNKPTCSLMTLDLRGNSLDERIAEYDARPGNHAYLSRQGLTARDMVLGSTVMALSGMQEMSTSAPGMTEGQAGLQVSAQNMAFHRSHKEEVMKTMQKASAAWGDKMPHCAR